MPHTTIAEHDIKRNGASDGNRTHATSLEGWDSTIELHSHNVFIKFDAVFFQPPIYHTTKGLLCQYFFEKFFDFLFLPKKPCFCGLPFTFLPKFYGNFEKYLDSNQII